MNRRSVVDFQAFSAWDIEPLGVEAEQVQHGGVDIGHVMRVLDGMKAEFIGGPMHHSGLDAGAGHPDGEGVRVMVAASGCEGDVVADFKAGRAAEFCAADDGDIV